MRRNLVKGEVRRGKDGKVNLGSDFGYQDDYYTFPRVFPLKRFLKGKRLKIKNHFFMVGHFQKKNLCVKRDLKMKTRLL